MRIFLAGIMQAQRRDKQIDPQDYRVILGEALQTHVPDVSIIDPWALNPGSVNFDEAQARHTFHTMTRKVREADLLIAYLPKVSMGTAMEMWEAYNHQVYIIAITPFIHHWAIKFTADEILPDLDTLLSWIGNGRFKDDLIPKINARRL